MSSKYISAYVIDVSPALSSTEDENGATQFDYLRNMIKRAYMQRIVHYPDDRLGIVLAGTTETNNTIEHDHVSVGVEIEDVNTITLSLLDDIETETHHVDITSGIAVASTIIQENHELNKRLRFGKQIVCFTNQSVNFASLDYHDYQPLCERIVELQQSIHCIGYGFTNLSAYNELVASMPDADIIKVDPGQQIDDDMQEDVIKAVNDQEYQLYEKTLLRNDEIYHILYGAADQRGLTGAERERHVAIMRKELLMRTICAQTQGMCYSYDEYMDLLNSFFVKPKREAPKMRGALNIGGDESIAIHSYTFTMMESIPSLKKWNKNPAKGGIEATPAAIKRLLEANDDPDNAKWIIGKDNDNNAERVSLERLYFDNQGSAVPKEEIIDGVKYGSEDIIPLQKSDIDVIKEPTTRELVILRLVNQQDLLPHYRMAGTDLIVADPGCTSSQHALAALVFAMREKKLSALVRYVKRANSAAEFGFLTTYISRASSQLGLVYNRLPLDEDKRNLQFPSLKLKLSLEDVFLYEELKNRRQQLATTPSAATVKAEHGDDVHDVEEPIRYDKHQEEADFDYVRRENKYPLTLDPEKQHGELRYGQTINAMTKGQNLFANIMEAMDLPPDAYLSEHIHNPLVHRFYHTLEQKLIDPQFDPATTREQFTGILDQQPVENPDHLRQAIEDVVHYRPVHKAAVVLDHRGRRIYGSKKQQEMEDAATMPSTSYLDANKDDILLKADQSTLYPHTDDDGMMDDGNYGYNLLNHTAKVVGTDTPIEDALSLIRDGRLYDAIAGLSAVVYTLAGQEAGYYPKAYEALAMLRKLCVKHHLVNIYNITILRISTARYLIAPNPQQVRVVYLEHVGPVELTAIPPSLVAFWNLWVLEHREECRLISQYEVPDINTAFSDNNNTACTGGPTTDESYQVYNMDGIFPQVTPQTSSAGAAGEMDYEDDDFDDDLGLDD